MDGTFIGLMLFGVGVIYSAGKVAKSVEHLSDEIKELKDQFASHNAAVATVLEDHGDRISKIEGRLT